MINVTALIYSITIPFVLSPLILIFKKKKIYFSISLISLLISLILISLNIPNVIQGNSIVEKYSWIDSFDIRFDLLLDVLSLTLIMLTLIVSITSLIYSYEVYDNKYFYFCLVLFSISMVGLFLSTNFIQFYLFWEGMVIPSYFLIAHWGTSEKEKIAFKYFIFMHIGAFLVLFGIVWQFTITNSFSIQKISLVPAQTFHLISIFFFLGFGLKMATFPLHNWLPDAHAEAPTPISSMLSGVMVSCGAYGLLRIVGSLSSTLLYWISLLAIITMYYGGLNALRNYQLKRALAFSTISQMGYILFGIGVGNSFGLSGALFHAFNHGISKALLFLCAGAVIYRTGYHDMRKMGGLLRKMPVTAGCFLVGALSLAAIPPLNAFTSEVLILEGAAQSGYLLFTFLADLMTVVTLAYMLLIVKRVFMGKIPENLSRIREAPLIFLIPMILLTAIIILIGIFPNILLDPISKMW